MSINVGREKYAVLYAKRDDAKDPVMHDVSGKKIQCKTHPVGEDLYSPNRGSLFSRRPVTLSLP